MGRRQGGPSREEGAYLNIDRRSVVGRSFAGSVAPIPRPLFASGPTRSLDSNYPFARHGKHLKRIGPLRSGRVLRHVLQTFREEDPLGFHDPARSLFNSSLL